MRKVADIGIGYRAAAEVRRLFPKKKHAIIAIGCGKNVLYECGADVIWILTGKRG